MKKAFRYLVLLMLVGSVAHANDSLSWRAKQNQVDADIENWNLPKLLKKISAATGWKVYVEPGTAKEISAKFKNVSEDEALRRLLGKLNFARDATNGVSRLLVFNTVSAAATQMVQAEVRKNYRIPNELLVRLKPNSKRSIEELAKRLGAKIIARDDRNRLYRLQFADENSADAALQLLNSNASVAQADVNYSVDRPAPVQLAQTGPAPPPGALFDLNPPAANGTIVGLVDTAVSAPDEFQKYLLDAISVAGNSEVPTDQPSHGTAMLETLLQAMASNPSKVLPVDIYGSGETSSTYEVIEGIIAAINAGANPINLSFGRTGNSDMVASLIQAAQQKGKTFVAAAGNDSGIENTYPAAYDGVLAVTASGPDGKLASYADDGPFVDAMEPGTSQIVWNGQEWVVQGTSPATATMTGSITALMNIDHISAQDAAARLMKIHPAPH